MVALASVAPRLAAAEVSEEAVVVEWEAIATKDLNGRRRWRRDLLASIENGATVVAGCVLS